MDEREESKISGLCACTMNCLKYELQDKSDKCIVISATSLCAFIYPLFRITVYPVKEYNEKIIDIYRVNNAWNKKTNITRIMFVQILICNNHSNDMT